MAKSKLEVSDKTHHKPFFDFCTDIKLIFLGFLKPLL